MHPLTQMFSKVPTWIQFILRFRHGKFKYCDWNKNKISVNKSTNNPKKGESTVIKKDEKRCTINKIKVDDSFIEN